MGLRPCLARISTARSRGDGYKDAEKRALPVAMLNEKASIFKSRCNAQSEAPAALVRNASATARPPAAQHLHDLGSTVQPRSSMEPTRPTAAGAGWAATHLVQRDLELWWVLSFLDGIPRLQQRAPPGVNPRENPSSEPRAAVASEYLRGLD